MSADVVGMERRQCIGGTTNSWENSGMLDHRMDRGRSRGGGCAEEFGICPAALGAFGGF